MIKNNFSRFLASYNESLPEVRKVIDGPQITMFVDALLKEHLELVPYRNDIVNLVVDIFLNIVGLRAAFESLRTDPEIGKYYNTELATQIENFINKLRSEVGEKDVPEQESVTSTVSENNKKVENVKVSDQGKAQALRTFESDIKNVHGYGVYLGQTDNENEGEIIHYSSQESVIPQKIDPPAGQAPSTDESRRDT